MTELPADRRIIDDVLGTFIRDAILLSDGDELIDDYFTQTREFDGCEVVLMIDTGDPAEARGLLPRLAQVVERFGELRHASVEAIVRCFSSTPPTDDQFADGARDLEPNTIVVDVDGDVVVHMTDLCGDHFLDGYWPAARFDADDEFVEVTVEA